MLCTHQEVAVDAGLGPEQAVRPPFDAGLCYIEDEDRARLDEGAAFGVVEAAGDAGDDALAGCLDEAEGLDGGGDLADERLGLGVGGGGGEGVLLMRLGVRPRLVLQAR